MKSLDNERYRRFAAQRLKCCWGECVGEVFFVTAVLTMAGLMFLTAVEILYKTHIISFGVMTISEGGWKIALIAAVYVILVYVALIPLKYSTAWFYFQQARSTSIPGASLFSCYMHRGHIIRTLELEFMVLARRGSAAVFPLAFIVFMMLHFKWLLEKDPSAAAVSLAVLTVTSALFVFIYIIFHMRYIFVPHLYASDPEKAPKEIIAESVRIAKGSRVGIIRLIFSLAPLWACCIAVLPLIFVIPYTKMTFAAAAAEIFNTYRLDEKRMESPEALKEKAIV